MIKSITDNTYGLRPIPWSQYDTNSVRGLESRGHHQVGLTDSINNSISRSLLVATLAGLGTPVQVFQGVSAFDRAPLPKPRPVSVLSEDPYTKIYGDPTSLVTMAGKNIELDTETQTGSTPALTGLQNQRSPGDVVFSRAIGVYEDSGKMLSCCTRGSQVDFKG